MANRYDRGPDAYGSGRRDPSREDERRRSEGQEGRYADERRAQGHEPWRGRDEQASDPDRRDYEDRSSGSREAGRDDRWRGRPDQGYYADRDNLARGQYPRDPSRDRNQSSRDRNDWGGRDDERYRGYYQEQVWTRDPGTGNVYGYELGARVDPRRFGAGNEGDDRFRSDDGWRSDVGEQNRRFDIDRGWGRTGAGGYGSGRYGTSGYGNATRGQSQFGRGPKGYVRSDDRIREDVCDRLSEDDEVDARDITVAVKNAEVTLDGTVTDRRSKHRAEDIVESISGVKEVINHLRARKTFFEEIGDKLSGNDDERHGHTGQGTRNSAGPAAPRASH